MSYKAIKKLLQVLIAIGIWGTIYHYSGINLWKTPYFKIWVVPSAVITAITLIIPGALSMGVSDFEKANFFLRLVPIAVVGILIYLLNNVTATYAIVAVTTYLMGAVISYTAYVVSASLTKKFKKRR